MIRILALLLALTFPAIAQPAGTAVDDAPRLAMLKALRVIGVEVGARWPIGDMVYEVEEVRIARSSAGELTVTVRTKLVAR
jgi:hypothetical protein